MNQILAISDSSRKWEKFSDEEIENLLLWYRCKDGQRMELNGFDMNPVFNKLLQELKDEQNFRLALKDAESETMENLEAASSILDDRGSHINDH